MSHGLGVQGAWWGGLGVTPSAGTPTPYVLDTDTEQASYSFSHTRAAGAGVTAVLLYRSTQNPSPTVSGVAFGGVGMTIQAQDKVDGANELGICIATIDDGTGSTGAQTVAFTMSGTASKDVVGFAVDVTESGGAASGQADAVSDAGSVTATDDITVVNPMSLLIGAGGCFDSTGALSAGSGWTELDQDQPISATNSVELLIQSLAPGATGVQACDVTIDASRVSRAACVVEWSPS